MELLVETIKAVWQTRSAMLFWPLLALVVSHGISFIQNYLRGGENRTATTEQLMQEPYSRIVLLHVVIIAGGFAVLSLDSPLPVLVLLVIGKIALDISLHIREHRPNRKKIKTDLPRARVFMKLLPSDQRVPRDLTMAYNGPHALPNNNLHLYNSSYAHSRP